MTTLNPGIISPSAGQRSVSRAFGPTKKTKKQKIMITIAQPRPYTKYWTLASSGPSLAVWHGSIDDYLAWRSGLIFSSRRDALAAYSDFIAFRSNIYKK